MNHCIYVLYNILSVIRDAQCFIVSSGLTFHVELLTFFYN